MSSARRLTAVVSRFALQCMRAVPKRSKKAGERAFVWLTALCVSRQHSLYDSTNERSGIREKTPIPNLLKTVSREWEPNTVGQTLNTAMDSKKSLLSESKPIEKYLPSKQKFTSRWEASNKGPDHSKKTQSRVTYGRPGDWTPNDSSHLDSQFRLESHF